MNEYVSYEELKEELRTTEVVDDRLLKRFCRDASRRFEQETKLLFYPKREARNLDHPKDNVYRLWLDRFLLELESVYTNDREDELAGCFLKPTDPPHFMVMVDRSDGSDYFKYTNTPQEANQVLGLWGYHDDYDNAWRDSGDTLQAEVDASATILTVSNVGGPDAWGDSPRFRVQKLLKIDSEFLYVIRADTDTELQVVRGVNGTVATTHAVDATIYVYQPPADAFEATMRLAQWMYRRKDVSTSTTTVLPELGVIEVSAGLPPEVQEIVRKYKKTVRLLR